MEIGRKFLNDRCYRVRNKITKEFYKSSSRDIWVKLPSLKNLGVSSDEFEIVKFKMIEVSC